MIMLTVSLAALGFVFAICVSLLVREFAKAGSK